MARAQRGDQEAYRTLLDDIGPAILQMFRGRVRDPHEAEDLCQETLIALHRARHTYDPSRPFEPWLFAIARNLAIDHARRRFNRMTWEVMVESQPDVAAEADAPMEGQLGQALDQLPPAQREAFEMLKLEGLSVEAAAARAGTTVGALKVRAHRAYRALKTILGQGES